MRMSSSSLAIALGCCALIPSALAAIPPESNQTIATKIDRLLTELDSDDYSLRTRAFEDLKELAEDNASRQFLADSLERAVVDAEISFEVRKQLERLRRDLPLPETPPSPRINADEIDRLVAQLGDDSYARRLGARSRLLWLVENAETAELAYRRLKHRDLNDRLTPEQIRSLKPIYAKARAAWLEDERRKDDPAVSAEEIDRLVERLAARTTEALFPLTDQPLVVAELRDLMASDRNVTPIAQALEARLANNDLDPDAERRLQNLLDLTKPAMAAEFWVHGRHTNIQRLLVDVPSETEGVGTSHFDRIDDKTAHVVCGVSLSEGDYPVGVAIPHPTSDPRYATAFFHLVNLPNPRRRMAYEYRVQGDETLRFRAIARRTLQRYTDQKIAITQRDLMIITQFDPEEVSHFAGQYLVTMDDRRVAAPNIVLDTIPTQQAVESEGLSIHGLLCSWLARKGTQQAVPGLLEAIEKNRVLPPSQESPYRFDRLAALAIAARDPWPEVESWLLDVVPRREGLVRDQVDGPELGATTAAILLRRHESSPSDLGLVECGDVITKQYGLKTYRYGAPDGPKRVAQWWATHQDRQTEETR